MIEFLRGRLSDLDPGRAVIDVNGVGYVLSISDSTSALMPAIGEEVKIYTYLSVREDGVTLYGFPTYEDLDIFKKLITVSGIGPKGALGILSVLTPDDLRFAILSGDSKAISKAPGIGKKTAERLILDLKDKMGSMESMRELSGSPSEVRKVSDSVRDDAVEALVSLGYSSSDAFRAVKEAAALTGDDTDADRLLQAALKVIM